VFGDGRIMRVSAAGGVATPLTAIASPNQFHAFPSFLQDGRHFVYLRFSPDGNQGIYVGSLDATPEQQSTQRLLDTPLMPTYAPSPDSGAGHLLFVRDGTLWSRPFDARRFALAGEAVSIAERVGIFRLGANFSTSSNGVLVYRGVGAALSRLTWYDRAGTILGPAGDQGAYWDVAHRRPDRSSVTPIRRSIANQAHS
jgi:eukaryotic-like serine/threonine-protein kinase